MTTTTQAPTTDNEELPPPTSFLVDITAKAKKELANYYPPTTKPEDHCYAVIPAPHRIDEVIKALGKTWRMATETFSTTSEDQSLQRRPTPYFKTKTRMWRLSSKMAKAFPFSIPALSCTTRLDSSHQSATPWTAHVGTHRAAGHPTAQSAALALRRQLALSITKPLAKTGPSRQELQAYALLASTDATSIKEKAQRLTQQQAQAELNGPPPKQQWKMPKRKDSRPASTGRKRGK